MKFHVSLRLAVHSSAYAAGEHIHSEPRVTKVAKTADTGGPRRCCAGSVQRGGGAMAAAQFAVNSSDSALTVCMRAARSERACRSASARSLAGVGSKFQENCMTPGPVYSLEECSGTGTGDE